MHRGLLAVNHCEIKSVAKRWIGRFELQITRSGFQGSPPKGAGLEFLPFFFYRKPLN
jgi:hypothetical protein